MAKETFKNLPDKSTPLSASKLNGLFDGAESMGSIVVEDVTCKNLFNINDISSGLAINDNGTSGASTKTDASGYIPVKAGQQYTFSYNYTTLSATAYRGYTFYASNRTYLNGNTYNPTDKKITITPTQDGYFRISYDKSCYNIQFEKGSVATNYVEHKEIGNKQHYSTEEQVIGTWIDGKPLYRKVVDFTISNTWQDVGTFSNVDFFTKIQLVRKTGGHTYPYYIDSSN